MLHKVHGPGLAVVAFDLLAQAVHHIGLVEDGISGVFFICQCQAQTKKKLNFF